MAMRGQPHAPAPLPLGKNHGFHGTGGWVRRRAGPDLLKYRKCLAPFVKIHLHDHLQLFDFREISPPKLLYKSLPSNKSDFFCSKVGYSLPKHDFQNACWMCGGFLVYKYVQSIWICTCFTYRPINEEYLYTKSQMAYRPHISLQFNKCQYLTSRIASNKLSTYVHQPWIRVANTCAVIIVSPFYICFPLISKFYCHYCCYCFCNSCLRWLNKGFSNFRWHLDLG